MLCIIYKDINKILRHNFCVEIKTQTVEANESDDDITYLSLMEEKLVFSLMSSLETRHTRTRLLESH